LHQNPKYEVRDVFEGRDTIAESHLVQNATQAAIARRELKYSRKLVGEERMEIHRLAAINVYQSVTTRNGALPTFNEVMTAGLYKESGARKAAEARNFAVEVKS